MLSGIVPPDAHAVFLRDEQAASLRSDPQLLWRPSPVP